jgi:hypothetical protein
VFLIFCAALWAALFAIATSTLAVVQKNCPYPRETATTIGKVIAFDPMNHATGTVEYWVGGVQFEQQNSGMSSSDVGSQVRVGYDPQNPSNSYIGLTPPSLNPVSLVRIIIVAISLLAVIAVLSAMSKTLQMFSVKPWLFGR